MNLIVAFALAVASPAPKVQLHYTLAIDTTDLRVVSVRMRITGAPDSFTVAAHAHPEYDDKYWRYLEDMQAAGGQIARRDSVLWQVTKAGSAVTLSYRIRLPETEVPRSAWRAYLTRNGGLVGGPHSFLYVVGMEDASATVSLQFPAGWTAATSLREVNGLYTAPNVFMLMESPILVGKLAHRQFRVKDVPHHVYYLGGVTPTQFDTTAFVGGIERMVRQTTNVFAAIPYDRYFFLLADDAYGGLEHPNSVTLGASSNQLGRDPFAHMEEFGHEFFHTWNLMAIKPVEYRRVDYRVQPPASSLWFSEGLSMFYADLLIRRAGFTAEEPTRTAHLQQLLGRYMADPAYEKYSAEDVSRTEYNTPPGKLGNYDPSSHVIGEVIGNALDLMVRDATDGKRNMDDVMRAMEARHSRAGFTGRDVERAVGDVCGCPTTEFFDRHVRGAQRIDMNRYLETIGLRMSVATGPAISERGEVERDFRIRAWQPTPQDTLRLMLFQGGGIWGAAGLNTNDRILMVNGSAVRTWPEFRTAIVAAPIGQTLIFDIVRDGKPMRVPVVMAGFQRTRVEVSELPNASDRQRRLRAEWLAGR